LGPCGVLTVLPPFGSPGLKAGAPCMGKRPRPERGRTLGSACKRHFRVRRCFCNPLKLRDSVSVNVSLQAAGARLGLKIS
jgi:hypothetical protein